MASMSKRFQHVAQMVTLVALLVNATLFATGTITGGDAVLLFLAVEIPLMCIAVLALVVAIATQCRLGLGIRESTLKTLGHSPFWPLIRAETRAYRALGLWIRRRHFEMEPGAVPISAAGGSLAIPVAFAIATAIEVVVLHLLAPWLWLQIALALVSAWSLIALFGYLAIHRTNPHYLTDTSLVLRQSGSTVIVIDRADIHSVVARNRFRQTAPAIVDNQLYLPNTDGTKVDLTLRSPVTAALPALRAAHRATGEVDLVSIYVDEPSVLISIAEIQTARSNARTRRTGK